MKLCHCCGEEVLEESTYKEMTFCSVKCMDRYLLHMCESGRISFLDLPKETRDRESNRKPLKCHSVECGVCEGNREASLCDCEKWGSC